MPIGVSYTRIGKTVGLVIALLAFVESPVSVLGKSNEYVTCGSVLKLMNLGYRVRLHSHGVKYGTGSGQQSVTGIDITEDVNSHWVIKGETGKHCVRGEAIKCGDVIRLEHLATGKNLHSHHFQSPLSGFQEISAYGEKGVGDTGDHWIVLCDGTYWERDDPIKLKHIDTNVFLSATGRTYGSPIQGQSEIVGVNYDNGNIQWKAMEGLFIHKTDFNPKSSFTHDPSEL
ncbi:UNVERIFIED_CONTAM: hypothetical protein PYX00_002311 [Menopon gallinae]|uniref:MIR domain-containing protein n=1 Tax=Menopon gallinae TaxID=328185 RepID=A0AAW2IGD9_9NEOP